MNTAIILAAGSGRRMEADTPKQYIELLGKPMMVYSLEVFQACPQIDDIILVVAEGDEEYVQKEIVDAYHLGKVRKVIAGGKERCDSVWNALQHLTERSAYVLIHDSARPMISEGVIERVLTGAKEHGSAVAGEPLKDTVKLRNSRGFTLDTLTLPRNAVWMVQTPQGFRTDLICEAYRIWKSEGGNTRGITDDAMMWEIYLNRPVKIVEGDYANLKVTTPEDRLLAECLIRYRQENLD